jgi:autonomous glycyl radical cofactor GrcA
MITLIEIRGGNIINITSDTLLNDVYLIDYDNKEVASMYVSNKSKSAINKIINKQELKFKVEINNIKS